MVAGGTSCDVYRVGLSFELDGLCGPEVSSPSPWPPIAMAWSLLYGSSFGQFLHLRFNLGLCLSSLTTALDWADDQLTGLRAL